jgi:hypothetical protein
MERKLRRKSREQNQPNTQLNQASPTGNSIDEMAATSAHPANTETHSDTRQFKHNIESLCSEQPECWVIESLMFVLRGTHQLRSLVPLRRSLSRRAPLSGALSELFDNMSAYIKNVQSMLQLAHEVKVLQYYRLGNYPGSISDRETELGKSLLSLYSSYREKTQGREGSANSEHLGDSE